jgi:putative peptidoglycan lipid II flippase
LAVSAFPLVSALFQGGKFTTEDARLTALTLSIIVLGLPAYVLVKVLTPGFYARQDTATPVKVAALVLVATVVLNFLLIPPFGIAGLAAVVAITSWLNCLILYAILHRRGHFRIEGWLASRIGRQLIAAAAMVAALIAIRMGLSGWFTGSLGHRLAGVIAIVGGGMAVYFPLVWVLGGTDREELRSLLRRRRPYTDAGYDACRLGYSADRRPPPRQPARRHPPLGPDAGRGRMPLLSCRSACTDGRGRPRAAPLEYPRNGGGPHR